MTSPTREPRRPRMSSGDAISLGATLLVLWLVATERWGSYVAIVPGHLYISDLAVAIIGLFAIITASVRRSVVATLRRPTLPIALCITLVVWSVARFAVGHRLNFTALRDFAPYGYAVIAVIVAATGRPRQRLRAAVWITLALHSVWLFVGAHVHALLPHLPVMGGAYALLPRPDVDGMVCGITIAICLLYAASAARARVWIAPLTALLLLTTLDALQLPSRGGLLASFVVLLPVAARLGKSLLRRAPQQARPLAITAGAFIVIGVVAAVVYGSTAGTRLQDGLALDKVSQAGGTTHARVLVYKKTTRYVLKSPERTTIGVGFGPDFLHESGAAQYLEGVYKGVRSPHDYLLGTWARLGLVGALIALALTLLGFFHGWTALAGDSSNPLDTLAAALLLATPVVAAVGVVLESPFGAIPWFWAFGILCARRKAQPPTIKSARRTPQDDVVRSAPAP